MFRVAPVLHQIKKGSLARFRAQAARIAFVAGRTQSRPLRPLPVALTSSEPQARDLLGHGLGGAFQFMQEILQAKAIRLHISERCQTIRHPGNEVF